MLITQLAIANRSLERPSSDCGEVACIGGFLRQVLSLEGEEIQIRSHVVANRTPRTLVRFSV